MAVSALASQNTNMTETPNIVIILADDLGYGSVGCYGATTVKTPNIDRLAKEGMRFTDAHSPGAVCSPSRYGLLTGQYPFRNPMYSQFVIGHKRRLGIDAKQPTIATLARSLGYKTGVFGKWHLGLGLKDDDEPDLNAELQGVPMDVGFDQSFIHGRNSGYHIYIEHRGVANADSFDPFYWNNGRLMGGAKSIIKMSESFQVFTQKVVSFIEQNTKNHVLSYFAPDNVHAHRGRPDKRFTGKSECGVYGDCIVELDWIFGEVLDALDRNGVADNTLIIFTSDNGGPYYGDNNPDTPKLRRNGEHLGQNGDVYEGGHRVPFIARWPGQIKPGTQSASLISLVDVMATMTDILHFPLPVDAGPDSFSFLHALTGENTAKISRESLVYQAYEGLLAVRQGSWVFIPARTGSDGTTFNDKLPYRTSAAELGFVNSDYTPDGKRKPDAFPGQLYDLSSDLSQKTN